MFGLIKKTFIRLLTNIFNASNYIKYVFLSNQQCTTQSTLINLHPNYDTQRLQYYTFAGSCITLNDLSNRICLQNKMEDLNLIVFNKITGINESETLTKHVS